MFKSISAKKLIPGSVRKFWLEMQRRKNAQAEQQVIGDILRYTGAAVVLDIGANLGQYGDLVLLTGFSGTIVSFEAIPAVHQQLVAHARRRASSWIVAPCAALGSRTGKVRFNVAANTVSSSVLPMRGAHLDAAPQSKYVEEKSVDLVRLDQVASGLIPAAGSVLIKIDTQGYEMEVLKGADGILNRAVALQVELSLVSLYEGAPSLVEMVSYVESNGFEIFSIVPGFQDERTGRLLQVDGFFVRSGSHSTPKP